MLPSVFDTPTIKDVTERYHTCIEITLPMNIHTSNNLAYLSFFNTQGELSPVAWGKVSHWRHRVTFRKVPVNMLFFPSYMSEDGQMVPFGKPFILKKDSVLLEKGCNLIRNLLSGCVCYANILPNDIWQMTGKI